MPTSGCLHFNSTMVRLKDSKERTRTAKHDYFNSTMVRLKAVGRAGCAQAVKFQFHYGTIKSHELGE